MSSIVIVDAVSTGYNLVDDAAIRGYDPVVIELKDISGDDILAVRASSYALFKHQPTILQECDRYEDTLEMIRRLDPAVVIAGAEGGVPLATRLAEDLGLPGNPTSILPQMTQKDEMHLALKRAGLRYIRGQKVKSVEEAVSFCEENGITKAVVKPLHSSASQGLYICNDLDEVANAVRENLSSCDFYGHPMTEVLVQERIFGTEFIVNTASCNGVHRLTSMMLYSKRATPEGGYVYDYAKSIDRLEPGNAVLVEYALKVVDAIGIKYGPVHGEYMIDENGPVLIEVNCRPMGCSMDAEFLDLIYGQHETDSALDCYLDPEKFKEDMYKPYRPLRTGIIKLVIVPEEKIVEDHPIWEIAGSLRSMYKISAETSLKIYHKTRDLESNGGVLYLVHDRKEVVMSDLDLLQKIEHSYFNFFLTDSVSRRWFIDRRVPANDYRKIIDECGLKGSILIASDKVEKVEGAECVTSDMIPDVRREFDNVIIGYRERILQIKESEYLRLIFSAMTYVKPGGKVIVPQGTWHYISYQREGTEVLLRVKGFIIEAPVAGRFGEVIGTYEGL